MKKEMIHSLERTTTGNARNVVEWNDALTEKVVFSWDSIAEESPSKDRYLKRNFLHPHIIKPVALRVIHLLLNKFLNKDSIEEILHAGALKKERK